MDVDATEPDETLPLCLICRSRPTGDAYELDQKELEKVVERYRARTAARVQRRYGAVPICRSCFDDLGFGLESSRPGDPSPLVEISRRRR